MSEIWERNIEMLRDTLLCSQRGAYEAGGRTIPLKLTQQQMREAKVFLPEDLMQIRGDDGGARHSFTGRCRVDCVNADSFLTAREIYAQNQEQMESGKEKPVLVLNLANAVHPGGGVRRGARAQEEELCRKSTLLVSLEGEAAGKYYAYNRKKNSMLGSDGIILSPLVEIFKDENGNYLRESVVVSVMTCAAPNVRRGFEGLNSAEYEQLLYRRIAGMFTAAAHLDYHHLVLGAFGCGAFANDARVVSRVFDQVMREFRYRGIGFAELFLSVRFAVLDRSGNQYNFRRFSEMFCDFYREEDRAEQ